MRSKRSLVNDGVSDLKGGIGDDIRLVLDSQHFFFNGGTKEYGPN